jgi:predicted ester cyclase
VAFALVAAGVAAGGAAAGLALRSRRRPGRATADPKLLARWVIEEPWKDNWHVLSTYVSTTYVGHDLAATESHVGLEGLREQLGRLAQAFPDGRVIVDAQFCEGQVVTSRWTFRGTQTGELDGIAPTGKQVTVAGMTISRVDGGVVSEEWTSWDRLGLLVQLGAVTEPAHA